LRNGDAFTLVGADMPFKLRQDGIERAITLRPDSRA
jgi:hypothetical protein